jgi:mono/diheme cytochrome c family protein
MGTARSLLLIVSALSCAVIACNGQVEERSRDEKRARIEAGAELFAGYCSACHGREARGDGPVASALTVKPADLTGIAARRGGRFEASEVAAYIDGRTDVLAHGRREMPVWGRMFDDRNESAMRDETLLSPGMIFAITAYLESIQAAAE